MENNALSPNIIQVKVIKQPQYGLGFLVRSSTNSPFVIVSDLVSGGSAAECGLVQAGDMLIKVDDISLLDKPYQEAVSILKSIPVNSRVVLLLRCQDGYTTHLETRFGEDGLPKTVRITEPINQPETFMSKIKKTFCLSNKISEANQNNIVEVHANDGSGNSSRIETQKCKVHGQIEAKRNILCECITTSGSLDVTGDRNGHGACIMKDFMEPTDKHGYEEEEKTILTNGCKHEKNDDDKSKVLEFGDGHYANASKARRGSCNYVNIPPRKAVKLINVGDEIPVYRDTLHMKALPSTGCTPERCVGSLMLTPSNLPPGRSRSKSELIDQAKDFIDQYYTSMKRQNKTAHQKRWMDVITAIENTGTYELTINELIFGAKTAWRNAPRCIGRIQWFKLQVFDARNITTARGMFEAICNHIKYGTNNGNIRSAITIFPPRTGGRSDFRVWNSQLISYAGYKQQDGSVVGDPINANFTELCQKLGWKGKNGKFDILPLVLQANEHDPELFEIPPDLVLEVNLKHPKFPWFADLGLKWYSLPAVSNMMFDCGGLEFTACPFNGWYMGTEIGARDLCDPHRYNILETVAEKMELDTRNNSSLWKDQALVEINVAVLYSFQTMGVTIMDHHAAAESFMKHVENEQRLRGGCPADWVWIVPPMSGSLLPVFRQEMLLYKLKPSFEYQEVPWKTHVWEKDDGETNNVCKPRRKIGFRQLAQAVKFSAKLMGRVLARRVKCTIIYATETGKSEGFAKTLCQIFKHAFDAKVLSMDEYDSSDLDHEKLLLIVTSTFGNGDPPENGEVFAKTLFEMKHPDGHNDDNGKRTPYNRLTISSLKDENPSLGLSSGEGKKRDDNLQVESGPLRNTRYSVFGLGSRAYPNFCAFAHYLDTTLHALSAERILKMGEGDELCGQKESFKIWAENVFKAACGAFCVGDEMTIRDAVGAFSQTDLTWSPGKFRLTPSKDISPDICEALSNLHGKTVVPCRLIESKQLQSLESSRQTLLVRLGTQGAFELLYSPGDHLAVFPENSPSLVDKILACLHNSPPVDQDVKIEMQSERTTPLGNVRTWERFPRFPVCTLRTALCRYLDITTPPSQSFLKILATQATNASERKAMENLADNIKEYEDWRHDKFPNLLEVMEQFPSLNIPASLILTQLPVLQQRYYSISSSPAVYPGEIHATVAVVKHRTQGGMGPLHEGVSSSWLNRITSGTIVPCFVRTAPSFHLPKDNTLPLIMVGPGTGIAPFRGFWQQRKIDRQMSPVPHSQGKSRSGWGSMYLYFGCRRSLVDDIYRMELQAAKKEGVLTNVYTAFSREPDKPKMYVQDYLLQNSTEIYNNILREGGHFYVCGDAKMATDVTSTLEKILQKEGNISAQDAKNLLMTLRDSNQFHEDIFWSNFKEPQGNKQGQVQHEINPEVHQSSWKTEEVPVITGELVHHTSHG
nr:Nitric oxide synthase [Sinohyriopsis cumingii]